MRTIFTLLLTATLASGCYTVKLVSPETLADGTGKTFHQWTHSLFWGLIPLGKVSLDQCGHLGVAKVKSQIGGLGLVGYALTAGIWTPMHVKVTCATPRTSSRSGGDPAGFVPTAEGVPYSPTRSSARRRTSPTVRADKP